MGQNSQGKGDIWDQLIAKYGETAALCGPGTSGYWREGRREWETLILPRIQPLSGDIILEWGAGSGRITQAAIKTMPPDVTYYAYDPSIKARTLWRRNLVGANAILLDEEGLEHLPPELSCIFSLFVVHHMTYDDLWEFFGYGNRLAAGGVLLFDYFPITADEGKALLRGRDKSDWPRYIWHPAQIEAILNVRAPSLIQEEVLENQPRRLEVWRNK